MDLSTFIPLLSLGTLGIVAVAAIISQQQTLKRMEDDKAPRSALAADGPNHGESRKK